MSLHLVGETIDKRRAHELAQTGASISLIRGIYVDADADDDVDSAVLAHAVRLAHYLYPTVCLSSASAVPSGPDLRRPPLHQRATQPAHPPAQPRDLRSAPTRSSEKRPAPSIRPLPTWPCLSFDWATIRGAWPTRSAPSSPHARSCSSRLSARPGEARPERRAGDAHVHAAGSVPVRDDEPDGPAAAAELLAASISPPAAAR